MAGVQTRDLFRLLKDFKQAQSIYKAEFGHQFHWWHHDGDPVGKYKELFFEVKS